MNNRLYVGGFPWATTEQDLRELFEAAEALGKGSILEITVMVDRDTKRSRGFAFVTMVSAEKAKKAIELFDGTEYGDRTLKVNAAKEREERSGGFGGNNRRSGGGYNSGNRGGSRGYNSDSSSNKDWQ